MAETPDDVTRRADLLVRLCKTQRVLRSAHARYRAVWTELLACRARIANQREQLAGMEAALLKERERAEAYRLAYESQKRRRQKLMARLKAAQTTIGAQQQYTERLEAEVRHG